MNQIQVILDKVLEASDNFQVEWRQLNLSLSFDDLLRCQFSLLLLQQDIVCKRQMGQEAIVLNDLKQFLHQMRPHT